MAEQLETSSSEALLPMTTHPYIINKSKSPDGLDERQMLRVDPWSLVTEQKRQLMVGCEFRKAP